ncbi:MAG TPA: hypothetical protein VE615_07295 [Gaiellaceae bacterium]|nr:hypothetical protein [Gaiellaceae bacterium]
MKARLPLALSVTALLVTLASFTPLGEAASNAIPRFARNADKVDGLHASRAPRAGRLLALNSARKFPASVLPPTAPAGVAGLEVLTVATVLDSSSPKSAVVNCPAGKKVIGGGARATGGGAVDVAVSEAYPSSTAQWTTLARETDATTASWTLTAYAFCAL